MSDEFRFILWRERDRRYLLLLPPLLLLLGALVVTLFVLHSPVRVDGDSMYPTLRHADRILITRGYPNPLRGDIVSMFPPGSGRDGRVLKRVIALEGDSVEIVGDQAFVNGALSTVAGELIVSESAYRLAPADVPEGTVFVLGDNRPDSFDSRAFGFVPLESIDGRATAIILPLHRFALIDPGTVAQ